MRRMPAPVMALSRFRETVCPRLAAPLAILTLLFSVGCLSTSVQVHPGVDPDTAGILIRVYADPDSAEAGALSESGTLVELFRVEGDGEEAFLQRSLAGEWGVEGLEPGRYRLRVPAIIDAAGNIRETRSGDRTTDVKLKAGKTSEVRIIHRKTPTGLIVAASVTVVFLAVAAAILLHEHDVKLPKPPLPPPGLLLPPVPVPFHPVVSSAEIWFVPVVAVERPERREPVAPPRITSVLPTPDSTVAARRVIPTVTISQPIDARRLTPGTVLMLGSASGMVPGTVYYRMGLLRFEPERDLVPGETVTVTVRAGGVVNPDGRRMAEDVSWGFRVAGVGEPAGR